MDTRAGGTHWPVGRRGCGDFQLMPFGVLIGCENPGVSESHPAEINLTRPPRN